MNKVYAGYAAAAVAGIVGVSRFIVPVVNHVHKSTGFGWIAAAVVIAVLASSFLKEEKSPSTSHR